MQGAMEQSSRPIEGERNVEKIIVHQNVSIRERAWQKMGSSG